MGIPASSGSGGSSGNIDAEGRFTLSTGYEVEFNGQPFKLEELNRLTNDRLNNVHDLTVGDVPVHFASFM